MKLNCNGLNNFSLKRFTENNSVQHEPFSLFSSYRNNITVPFSETLLPDADALMK